MRPTRIRHVVLWLTVAAYMITYMDRVVLSTAIPMIQKELQLDTGSMGLVTGAFRWGYALFQIPGGWLGDVIGPRKALTAIVIVWSIFTSLTAASWNLASMIIFRFLFGIGEAGAFPIATRSLSRWMLPTERGYSQGVTHAGSRLGGALTPALVVYLTAHYGWRSVFVMFGAIGVLWALIWFVYYRDTPREHKSVNAAELELIEGALGKPKPKAGRRVPWGQILRSPTLWNLSVMYFCYGWCLAIYLDWFPTYLNQGRGLSLRTMGFYATLPLLAGTVGDFFGGWVSDRIAHSSGNLRMARRLVGVACVAFTCLALFGLEVTVGVSWAVPLDIGGDFAGSVSSVMNMCGNMGGAISSTALGYLVQAYGWSTPFLAASAVCALAAILFARIDATKRVFEG